MGLAIAGLLASLGADIALHGLGKPEDIEHVVKALRKRHDVHVQHFEGDFTDSSCFVPMIECIAAALGAPDILITNAGMQRSEEHTSELQSLMRISYAVFCLKKKTKHII